MMERLVALLLVLACGTASAEIFRRIGPDGEVYFSDRAGPDAVRMEVGPAQTLSMPTARPETAAPAADDGQQTPGSSYAQFNIVKPSHDQGVRANDGSVTVYLAIQPPLKAGHMIVLNVDGEDGEKIHSGDTLNFNLSNMSRGRHSVAAKVVDEQGNGLIETGPVGFYVLRTALRPRAR